MKNRLLELEQELSAHTLSQAYTLTKNRNHQSQNGWIDALGRYSYGRDVIEMEPVTITISKAEKDRILRSAGWKKSQVVIAIKNFNGEPLLGHKLFAEFKAPKVATQSYAVDIHGGSAIFSDIWIKPSGTLRLMAVSIGTPSLVPQGVIHYSLQKNHQLRFIAMQKPYDVKVTATSSQEAASKVGAKGTMGVDFKVFSAGGEVSGEESRKKGRSRSLQYIIRIPTSTLDISPVR